MLHSLPYNTFIGTCTTFKPISSLLTFQGHLEVKFTSTGSHLSCIMHISPNRCPTEEDMQVVRKIWCCKLYLDRRPKLFWGALSALFWKVNNVGWLEPGAHWMTTENTTHTVCWGMYCYLLRSRIYHYCCRQMYSSCQKAPALYTNPAKCLGSRYIVVGRGLMLKLIL